ncbi:MAG: hypothetical protein RL385_6134 [Pseudomonadota bacterium]|jgi:hypothetical protein
MRRLLSLPVLISACAAPHGPSEAAPETLPMAGEVPPDNRKAGVDAAARAADAAAPPNADASQGLSTAPDIDAADGSGIYDRPACFQALDVAGEGPRGAVQLSSVIVRYTLGDELVQDLIFNGESAGSLLTLGVRMPSMGLSPAEPGKYSITAPLWTSAKPGTGPWKHTLRVVESRLAVELQVSAHSLGPLSSLIADGENPIALRGVVRIAEADWDVVVPFDLSVSCDAVLAGS